MTLASVEPDVAQSAMHARMVEWKGITAIGCADISLVVNFYLNIGEARL